MPRLGSILIVEDDDLIRELLITALDTEGYTVRGASDRTSMHAAFAARSPDLLIYDADLDCGSDPPILEDVRATYGRAVPMILMTTSAWTARSLARQNLSFCLLKPFQLDALFACVAEHLGANVPVRAREAGTALGYT